MLPQALVPRTGWPPRLLQDDSRGLARWLSSRACGLCLRAELRRLVAEMGLPGVAPESETARRHVPKKESR